MDVENTRSPKDEIQSALDGRILNLSDVSFFLDGPSLSQY